MTSFFRAEDPIRSAVEQYWATVEAQGSTEGGKHMDGFCELAKRVVVEGGMPEGSIHLGSKLELPGYFRPTKQWDMLVVHNGCLVAAIEFKSMGKSFGKNYNNRIEEALGSATDILTAHAKEML